MYAKRLIDLIHVLFASSATCLHDDYDYTARRSHTMYNIYTLYNTQTGNDSLRAYDMVIFVCYIFFLLISAPSS